MTVAADITRELMLTDTVVEATFDNAGMRRYALEAGTRICMIPAVRAARVDSADLIGFIYNTVEAEHWRLSYDDLAEVITERFNLDKEH